MPSKMPSPDLLETLRGWVDADALRALDLAFTRFVAEQGGETDPAVLLAVALTSERNGHGHVCLDLDAALRTPQQMLSRLRDDAELSPSVRGELVKRVGGLRLNDWVERLAASSAITAIHATAGAEPTAETHGTPLVLAGTAEQPLLYLRRYWQYEQRIRTGIEARLARPMSIATSMLRQQLDAIFADDERERPQPDWQRIACALAAHSRFFIITGGPGTGKTTTVVRLLAVLQALAAAAESPALRIELAAPTGKAAARLNESITEQVDKLPGAAAASGRIPTQVKTLHRLLGTIPGSRHFRHHAANPLPADVVVVDEASMVDVEMMAHLLEALRPDARLVLLGDKDQLSSVEAGAVLGDLCQRAERAYYLPETDQWLQQASGEALPAGFIDAQGTALDQAIVMLRNSYRFRDDGGIGALAKLVNANDEPSISLPDRLREVQSLFEGEQRPALGVIQRRALVDADDPQFAALIEDAHGAENSYLRMMRDERPPDGTDQAALDDWGGRVLQAQKAFQLLTPLRQGAWGVEGLNQRIVAFLEAQGLLIRTSAQRQWFAGRPVLVTRNDYSLNLMNGDIGITLSVPIVHQGAATQGDQQALRVVFRTVEGGVRWVLPSRLQAVETVFAMTVHKSQGSEFSHTALILPDRPNPVLTRELLYTAITRAKQRFTLLYSDEAVLGAALAQRVQRVSGLRDLGGEIGHAV